jgi:hypothetical protein
LGLLTTGSLATSGESFSVSVEVKADGQSCLVRHREIKCGALSSVLSKDVGLGLNDAVSVSPEGCGELALAQAREVAGTLRKAGFTQVFVVGFLTEPNTKCAA